MRLYDKEKLENISNNYDFSRDMYEKVLRLRHVLKYFSCIDILSKHLALKGGTAINMAIFDLPRLSVDIDLDYIPNDTKEEMLINRELITDSINQYMINSGYTLTTNSKNYFSLDSFVYRYINTGGNYYEIKIEINYSLRSHFFEPIQSKLSSNIFDDNLVILTLNPMEIFASKTNALLSRAKARDLYDFINMIDYKLFDGNEELFKKCIIFYNTISQQEINKNFNTSAIDLLTFRMIKRDLFPLQKKISHFDLETHKSQAKEYIHNIMKINDSEKEYMERFENEEYRPELLFDNSDIINKIINHPMALWKCK
ncbi:MAG: nucleotidyl transferase AbiEii/AbiGii toxin family protein [Erysipelotrichaceae bacterium]|nr:nucleotidyl transferase AbiEii/AbiGii toxin family protein [Erysipelotrichaceae bacterium]